MGIEQSETPDLRSRFDRLVDEQARILSEEGEEVVDIARALSPVDTGLFQASWRYAIESGSLLVISNGAARNGRRYDLYVHRAGDFTRVMDEVGDLIRARSPDLAARLSEAGATLLTGG
jgi:hypothetical protein